MNRHQPRPWPALDPAELRYGIAFGSSVAKIAEFLQRDVEDVRAEARSLKPYLLQTGTSERSYAASTSPGTRSRSSSLAAFRMRSASRERLMTGNRDQASSSSCRDLLGPVSGAIAGRACAPA